MRLGLGVSDLRRIAALGVLLSLAAAASAGDLVLVPQVIQDQDLLKVAPTGEGSIAVLHQGGVDLVQPGGAHAVLARPSAGEVLFLSDEGWFIGVATYREGAADFAPTASFELRDRTGKVLWRTGPTEDVNYVISKGGTVVGMSLNINVPQHNRLHFYNTDGTQAAEVEVPYLESGRFDPEGGVFLALSTAEGLKAFDPSGTELWTVQGARMFAAAPGGERVAVLGDGWLSVVHNGSQIASIPLDEILVRRIAIAPDGSRVAIAGKQEIRVYNGESLTTLWTRRLEEGGLAWTSVDVGVQGRWLLAGVARDLGEGVAVEKRHPAGEVRAYDASGQLAHRAPLEFPVWNIWTPTVLLDRSGAAATITTRRAVYRTVLP